MGLPRFTPVFHDEHGNVFTEQEHQQIHWSTYPEQTYRAMLTDRNQRVNGAEPEAEVALPDFIDLPRDDSQPQVAPLPPAEVEVSEGNPDGEAVDPVELPADAFVD